MNLFVQSLVEMHRSVFWEMYSQYVKNATFLVPNTALKSPQRSMLLVMILKSVVEIRAAFFWKCVIEEHVSKNGMLPKFLSQILKNVKWIYTKSFSANKHVCNSFCKFCLKSMWRFSKKHVKLAAPITYSPHITSVS